MTGRSESLCGIEKNCRRTGRRTSRLTFTDVMRSESRERAQVCPRLSFLSSSSVLLVRRRTDCRQVDLRSNKKENFLFKKRNGFRWKSRQATDLQAAFLFSSARRVVQFEKRDKTCRRSTFGQEKFFPRRQKRILFFLELVSERQRTVSPN